MEAAFVKVARSLVVASQRAMHTQKRCCILAGLHGIFQRCMLHDAALYRRILTEAQEPRGRALRQHGVPSDGARKGLRGQVLQPGQAL